MIHKEISPWDVITDENTTDIARKMNENPSYTNKGIKISLEHRLLVLILLSRSWKYKDGNYTTTTYPVWRISSDTIAWSKFGDFLVGNSFAECLRMALELCDLDGRSESYVPSWRNIDNDSAEYVLAKTCTAAVESEDELSEEAKMVLSLPPAVIVAMHFWARQKMVDSVLSDHVSVYEGDMGSTAKSIKREFPLLLEAFVKGYPEILTQTVSSPI